jgi:hypothetical protein
MGSTQFFLELHNALEPWCFARSLLPASEIKFEIKFKTKKGQRFMGSVHGVAAVHNALEPAGTLNVQRSTFNGKPSTINLSTINRFMGRDLKRQEGRTWVAKRAAIFSMGRRLRPGGEGCQGKGACRGLGGVGRV